MLELLLGEKDSRKKDKNSYIDKGEVLVVYDDDDADSTKSKQINVSFCFLKMRITNPFFF